MKGKLLHFLIACSVILAGLHLSEPAMAHPGAEPHQHGASEVQQADAPDNELGDHHGKRAGSCHHHCPVAPDLAASSARQAPSLAGAIHFRAPADRLSSYALEPPVNPPIA